MRLNPAALLTFYTIVIFSVSLVFIAPLASAQEQGAAARWVLPTLDGEQVNLAERVKSPDNKILVFWATWCPYCKQLMPIVDDIKKDYPDLEVLAFNVFDDLQPAAYPVKAPWPFIHVLGADEFARAHGVKGLPTLFLVDKNGKMILDLREIDTKAGLSKDASNSQKASHHAPLWNKGLREALDTMNWEK